MTKRMFLVTLAAATVALSSGAVHAQQVVVCNPSCGLMTANEAAQAHGQQGRDNAAAKQLQVGAGGSSAGGNSGGNSGGGGGGPVIIK